MAKAPKTRSAKTRSTTSKRRAAKAPPSKSERRGPSGENKGLGTHESYGGDRSSERTRQPRQFGAWTRDFGECTSAAASAAAVPESRPALGAKRAAHEARGCLTP